MLYLSLIFHMHQPYYKDILKKEFLLPWVRLHGIKDYLDMVKVLSEYPNIHLTFNLVPSLIEQISDYIRGESLDKWFNLSYKSPIELTKEEKEFILANFFSANEKNMISVYPRYYELFLKKRSKKEFSNQDILDLQLLFNLSWIDPIYRNIYPELNEIINKGRFFDEEEKFSVLNLQEDILKAIIPTYRNFQESGQIETTISPYYHPILPLIYNSKIALEANPKAEIPKEIFSYPEDIESQIKDAIELYEMNFKRRPSGFWPSEEAVSEHILSFIIKNGIDWIVTDEAILFRSLKKRRKGEFLYKAYKLEREEGRLNIIFRDKNLSDLISFIYYQMPPRDAVDDFLGHLDNISEILENPFIVIALDGENAWEYYKNDGWDFLKLLYERLSESKKIKTVTVSEYLNRFPPKDNIKRLSAGSWIAGNFSKWMGKREKNIAWEYLTKARKDLEDSKFQIINYKLAYKQLLIAEGSDWFWWFGEDPKDFDELFRKHLSNFYTSIEKPIPDYLSKPIQ